MLGVDEIAELNIEIDGVRLDIKKVCSSAAVAEGNVAAKPAEAMHREGKSVEAKPAEKGSADADTHLIPVVSPMIGTFYRALAPDAPPYVEVGSIVQVGQPVCIVEALKLKNEIESEVAGKIVKILVEDGQGVEYGQALFLIEKQ